MTPTTEAGLLFVLHTIGGGRWYTSTKRLQEASIQVCTAVRRVPRAKLVVRDDTPPVPIPPVVLANETHPEIHVSTHGTRVPRILAHSVEWDLLSAVVLSRYMSALADVKDMMFSERYDDRVQGVTWPDSVVSLEFGAYFDQAIDGVQWPAFLEDIKFGSLFNHALGGATWPSTLERIVVSADFDRGIEGVTSVTGSAIDVVMPYMLD